MPRLNPEEYYNPFSPSINPYKDIAWTNVRQWILDMGLVHGQISLNRLDRSNFSELAARVYPVADSTGLELAMCWLCWLFLIDDQLDECHLGHSVDEGKSVINGVRSFAVPAAEINTPPKNAVEKAWVDFWKRISPGMSPTLQQRFLQHVRNYMDALSWEVENRGNRQIPDFITYAESRRSTGAMGTVYDLIEYSNCAEVPAAVYNSSDFQTLRNCSIDVVCITNDILSYDKEIARHEVNNYVVVCQNTMNGGVLESMRFVNNLQTGRIQLFLQTKRKLSRFLRSSNLSVNEKKATWITVEGMQHWMRGNLDFTLRSSRYTEIEKAKKNQPISWIENITAMPASALVAPIAIENHGNTAN